MKTACSRPMVRGALAFGPLFIAILVAFAPSVWPTMMARSFIPQWIALFVLVCGGFLMKRCWREGTISACASGLLLLQLSDPGGLQDRTGPASLRIAHFNVLQTNRSCAAAIRTMLATDADVISVQEVDPRWAEELRNGLASGYPFQILEPGTNCYGIALFCRVPWSDARVIRLASSPAIEVTLGSGDRHVRLIAMHASSPGSPGHFKARNEQFRRLGERVRASSVPVIVVGDMNAAPWDRDLEHLFASTSLRTHASVADPTFPSIAHLALIPIDHILTDDRIQVRQRSIYLPGSDHRGLVADLAFRP